MSLNEQQINQLNHRISDLSYLVYDSDNTWSEDIVETLRKLGVATSQVEVKKSLDESFEYALNNKPEYFICLLDSSDKEIFKLIDLQKRLFDHSFDKFFLAVAKDKSIYTFAQALEEDIDDYIVEPFTEEKLATKIRKSVAQKTFPTQYKYILNEVKEKAQSRDFMGAQVMAQAAMAMHPRPSMVFYYLAKIEMSQGNIQGAINQAIEGLRFNKEHYRCLLILHDLYFQSGNFEKAYKVLKAIFKTFPLSMIRIYEMFKLAILSSSFDDLNKYCTKILEDETNIDIIRFCDAGLVICALNYLQNDQEVLGVELLKKALKYSQNDPKILRNIFKAYNNFRLWNNAEEAYKAFKPSDVNTLEFKVCAYLRELNTSKPIQMIIDESLDRLKEVQFDEDCLKFLKKKVEKEADEQAIKNFNYQIRNL